MPKIRRNINLEKSNEYQDEPISEDKLDFYGFILLLEGFLLLIIMSIFIYSIYPTTEKDSAKYLLSTIIQGEITIITIVLSLYLIVVQLVASAHSPRAIEAFRRDKYIWILLFLYIISITVALFVLKSIESNTGNTAKLELWILLSLDLAVISLLALLPFAWKTLSMLNPMNILDIISEDIKQNDLLTASGVNKEILQPISDIILTSIKKNDFTTIQYGSKIIFSKLKLIISENKINKENEYIISKTIFHHPHEICRCSIIENCEYLSIEVTNIFKELVLLCIENRYKKITLEAISKLGQLGVLSSERKMATVTTQIILQLRVIGENALKEQRYVFSWDKVPGEDEEGLRGFLKREFNLEWVKTAEIKKVDLGNTIKLFIDKNLLFLKLNHKKNEVVLDINGIRTSIFIADMNENELKIYEHQSGLSVSSAA